jgi:hypothetical protein
MHGGFESTGSQVSHLNENNPSIHWFTGTTLPCLSSYKPYIFPVEGQKYDPPGPYLKIDSNWSWVKHTMNKSRKIAPKLIDIENNAISQVNDLIKQAKTLPEDEFVNKIKALNNEIWKKSENLL